MVKHIFLKSQVDFLENPPDIVSQMSSTFKSINLVIHGNGQLILLLE